jgi:hypothetical protein
MGLSKIKTLIIAALVLINALFLIVIIADSFADARNARLEVETVCTILQTNGIEIYPECVGAGNIIKTMRTARGEELEAQIANVFLGSVKMTDQGIIILYENPERGTAEFHSAGDFKVVLEKGAITDAGDALKTVKRLVREMRLETSSIEASFDSNIEVITAVSAYRGGAVFNCSMEFVFTGGSLKTVNGRYIAGVETAEDGTEISRAGTALLGFLSAVMRGDIECKQIHSVESGYQHSVFGPFGEGVLSPSWMITADSGRYVVDSATGEIRPI